MRSSEGSSDAPPIDLQEDFVLHVGEDFVLHVGLRELPRRPWTDVCRCTERGQDDLGQEDTKPNGRGMLRPDTLQPRHQLCGWIVKQP
jgi:hypothetical protein